VELDARGSLDPEQLSQTGLRQIRKWLGDEGLVVSAVTFRTRGGYGDAERLEGRIAATKSAMELAHGLGAHVVTNHIGDVPLESEGPQGSCWSTCFPIWECGASGWARCSAPKRAAPGPTTCCG